MGKFNSSLTRVRPFFRTLITRDPSGSSWLPRLLSLAQNRQGISADLVKNPGSLCKTDLDKEEKLYPPEEFLRWLILNPERMTWPQNGLRRFSNETQRWREMLMSRGDSSREPPDRQNEIRNAEREEAIREGISKLASYGSVGSFPKWWAFEGRTSVDCYLATDRLRIYVEGKRTEALSSATDWYPSRNQMVRNIESAGANANGIPFGCLLITEEQPPTISKSMIQASLPHMAESEQNDLMRHFLGSFTWRQACEATGVDYEALPLTV